MFDMRWPCVVMPIHLPDARQLSREAIQVLRLRALRGIELGYSEVELAELLGVRHETISRWWTSYRTDGLGSLPGGRTGRPIGSGRSLSEAQAGRIRGLIDDHSPAELGIAHALWTRRAVGDLIRKEFSIEMAERTVGLYLRRWGYTSKVPGRRSRKQDPDEIGRWLAEEYPAIEARAAEEGGEILWVDEVGVDADNHPGRGYARQGERAGLLPVFWSTPNGSLPQRMPVSSISQLITSFIEFFRSHSSLNSRGVLYPIELCGRIVLYSRRNQPPFARASATLSNSTRSRNSSRNRLWNDSM